MLAPSSASANDGLHPDPGFPSWARRVLAPEREGGLTELALEGGYGRLFDWQIALLRARATYRFEAPWSVGVNIEPGVLDVATDDRIAWVAAPRIEAGFDHDYVGLEARLGYHMTYMIDEGRELSSSAAYRLRTPMAGVGFRVGARDGIHVTAFFDVGLTRRDRGAFPSDHVRRGGGTIMVPVAPRGSIGHGLLVTSDEILADIVRFRVRVHGDRGRGTVFLTGAVHLFYNPNGNYVGHLTPSGTLGAEVRL